MTAGPMLSPHFSRAELTTTSTWLQNNPGNAANARLVHLAVELLEPVRELLGVPLRVNSGFRSAAVNTRIGGSRTSAHLTGDAADVVPVGLAGEEAMRRIVEAHRAGGLRALDQAIVYAGGMIHLGCAREGRQPRGELLRSLARSGSGGPYVAWTPLEG